MTKPRKEVVVWVSRDKDKLSKAFFWGVQPHFSDHDGWSADFLEDVEASRKIVNPGECRAFKLVPVKEGK